MAYKIIASQCTVCGACEFECPNAAISLKNEMYIIDPKKCTECESHFDAPQCVQVCPVDCIPLNPDHIESNETLWAKYRRLQLTAIKAGTT